MRCSRALHTWAQLVGGGPSALGMFVVVTLLYWFGVVGLSTLGLNLQVRACLGGPPALGMSIFVNMLYWFGVVGLCTLGVDQQGRASSFLKRLY